MLSIRRLSERQPSPVHQRYSHKDLDELVGIRVKKGFQRLTANDNADLVLPRSRNYGVDRGADERGPICVSYSNYIEEMLT
jgi:hypothetical protein